MAGERYLIVNADDFGLSYGVNRGIIEAHEHGIVTSASLMVRWAAAVEAARFCREHTRLSLGLHLDLGEWVNQDGTWMPLYEVVFMEDTAAVVREVKRQLELFRDLVGREPSHIDSHQHVHRAEPLRAVMLDIARRLNVPLRQCVSEIAYRGDFYGQAGTGELFPDNISSAGLIKLFPTLQPGITELGCHPGFAEDVETVYREERADEVKTLCDPCVRTALINHKIELRSFANIFGKQGKLTFA
jgi:predicted glycoside hydrolase/deacetylase ChbG (UPF0249 family)